MVKITYKVGDKVFAKVKGYPPWPARIEGDTGKKKYNVLFYGTKEVGAIKAEDICYYLKNKDSYITKYTKRVGYDDAVKEIEEAIKQDGGDGSNGNDADESLHEIETSDTSSISSASEKKAGKRKTASLSSTLSDEPTPKKPAGKGRRKSSIVPEAKDSTDEKNDKPTAKRGRRRSSASDGDHKEDIKEAKKPKVSSDNGAIEEVEEEKETEISEPEKSPEKKTKTAEVEEDSPEETNKDSVEESEATDSNVEQIEKTNEEETKKLKETDIVKVEATNGDEEYAKEEQAQNDETKPVVVKVEIVTEQTLNNNILYAEYVKKNEELYKDKPVEARKDSKNQVLPVKLPSGILCGLKLHNEWPLKYKNEYDRALYDEQAAKSLLEVKNIISTGDKPLSMVENVKIIHDIQMTADDVKEKMYTKDIELKRKRLQRLKREAELVTWDSQIKNSLGLDKANPEAALECLKEFSDIEKGLDALMFKKHPHVVDTVRRLRKYVGNIKEWGMSDSEVESFVKIAEKIRTEAEKIYNKIKNIVKISDDKGTFWDSFLGVVADFRTQCKDLSESQILVLCAEPNSRQAFLDRQDEVTEPESTPLNPSSNNTEPVLKETSVQGWTEKK